MPYIIDGHNLIPKVPGLNLKAVDDELQLIELLQEFCRSVRKNVEIYFDNAPPGLASTRRFGRVTARFVRQGTTADDAIRERLRRLGGEAHNWTVVSSDQAVQSAARAVRAQVVSSEDFVGLLRQSISTIRPGQDTEKDRVAPLSPNELKDWLDLFGVDEKDE